MAASSRFLTTYTSAGNPAGASEAVIATLSGNLTLYAGQSFKLHGNLACQVAASTASVILKIRRDSLTGTVVATSPTYNGGDVTTPKLVGFDVYGTDQVTDVSGQTYVLTVTLASAGGATTVSSVFLEARVD
jgi:hypothetical protein